ncbi:MAG: CHAT domain-containing protein [Chitinophagales bacterium]|nr:CHAT domain-containing protein [Chitinophagales bacterium]
MSKINAYAECSLLANSTYYSYINGYDTTRLNKTRDSLFSVINWDGNSYWCYVYSINNKFESYYRERNIRLLISALDESIKTINLIAELIDKDSSIEKKEDYYGLLGEFSTNIGLFVAKYQLAIGYNKEAYKTFKYYFSNLLAQGLNSYSIGLVSNMYSALQEEFIGYYNELEYEHRILPVLDSFYARYYLEKDNINFESDNYKNLLPFFHPSTQTYYENKYNIRFETYFETLLTKLKTENRLPTQNELKFVSKCYDYFASINDLLIGYSGYTHEKFKTKFKTVYTTDTLNYIMDDIANVHGFPEDKLHLLYNDDFAFKYLFQKEIMSLRYHNTIEIQRAQYFKENYAAKKLNINRYLMNRSITDFDKIDYIITDLINTYKHIDTFDGTIESYNISEMGYRNILLNDTVEKLYERHFEVNAFSEDLGKGELFLSYSRIKKEYDARGIYDFNPKKKNDFNDFQLLLYLLLSEYKRDSVYSAYKYVNYAKVEKDMIHRIIDIFTKKYHKSNKNTDIYLSTMRKDEKFRSFCLKLKNNSIPEIPSFSVDTKFDKKNYHISNKVYKLIKNSNRIYTFNDDIGIAINNKTGNYLMFDFEIHKISSLTDFFWNKYNDSIATSNQFNNDTFKKEALLIYNPSYSYKEDLSFAQKRERSATEDLSYYIKDEIGNTTTFSQLPATYKEGTSVESILRNNNILVNSFSGDSATEDKYYRVKSPYIMHFATHTYRFNTDTMDAAVYFNNCLVFANANNSIQNQTFDPYRVKNDALLSGFEILNQDLHNTELVVLSACETAIGTENNIFNYDYQNSLQRAFRLAGAKAVLASKWKVPDKQTQELMVEFYTNWLEKKMTKHKALQQAQLTLSKKYPEPYYWAAWVLYGE